MATASFQALPGFNLETGLYRPPAPAPTPAKPRGGLKNPFGLNPLPHVAINIRNGPEQIKAKELAEEKEFGHEQLFRRVLGYPFLPMYYNKQNPKKSRKTRRFSRSKKHTRRH